MAYIHQKLSWDELSDALVSLDSLHPKSLHHLNMLGTGTPQFQTADIDVAFEAALLSCGLATQRVSCYIVSDLGRKIYYYGLKADFDAIIPPVGGYDKRSPEEQARAQAYLTR